MMFRKQDQGRKKALHGVVGGAPLAKIMRDQMMMSAGIYPNLRHMGTGTPNPINTNVNSSMIQELEGLPTRLNGKTKY
jgi:hypothetical protein